MLALALVAVKFVVSIKDFNVLEPFETVIDAGVLLQVKTEVHERLVDGSDIPAGEAFCLGAYFPLEDVLQPGFAPLFSFYLFQNKVTLGLVILK